ncbi:MAG: hypothetical protein K0Q68_830 [Moraxellaceae bacterium]|jgi:hypothetical protein|nr:hypothetical protein [Moraxellaceae bacterium]
MTTPPERPPLSAQIRRDMVIDLIGNLALALGLWGWLDAREGGSGLLQEPALFIALTAAGLLNLLHLPARLRRLRDWRNTQPPR